MFLPLFLTLLHQTAPTIVFQQSNVFGALQIRLTTSTGFITPTSTRSFSIPNNGYANISTLGLALCGYDIPSVYSISFRAEASYDSDSGTFVVLVLPANVTQFASLTYFLLVSTAEAQTYLNIQSACLTPAGDPFSSNALNRIMQFTLVSPFLRNSSSKLTLLPYLRSFVNQIGSAFNYLNITSAQVNPNSTVTQIGMFINYTYVTEVCLSLLYYYDAAVGSNSFVNATYSGLLVMNSSLPALTLGVQSQANFSMPSIYGPRFGGKCLIGFQTWKLPSSSRQTFIFNLTGEGVYGIITSSSYELAYSWFCLASITCQNGLQYYPAINDCEPPCEVTNCSVCSSSTSCQLCDRGFWINQMNRCAPCPPNCLNCTNAQQCLQCANRYYYNSTACTACPVYCAACSPSACSLCDVGYYPNGNLCTKCSTSLSNCLQCSTGSYCSKCPENYFYNSQTQGCTPCTVIKGCRNCGSSTQCYTCLPLFYITAQQICKGCTFDVPSCCPQMLSNCSVCKSDLACSICQTGFYVNDSQLCVACGVAFENCTLCTNDSRCTGCADGSFLHQMGNCYLCETYMPGCRTCRNQSACLVCTAPLIVVNGTCLACPIWPLKEMYFLVENTCVGCGEVTPNCIRCTDSQTCTRCSDLYYLHSLQCNSCSLAMKGCLSCRNSSSCQLCQNGLYVPSNASQCLPCLTSIPHCLSCVQWRNQTNSSLLCLICQPQYYLNTSLCSPCLDSIPFCLTCLNNFQCSLCEKGYFLSSTLTCITCSNLIAGCLNCLSTSECGDCADGYYLNNNYCTACSVALLNCGVCGRINGTLTCASCLIGYFLGANFTCFACNSTLAFCAGCTSRSSCSICISGYAVNPNLTCSPCPDITSNCEYCLPSRGCLKCLPNYILNPYGDCSSCSLFIPGCLTCKEIYLNTTNSTQLNCSACQVGQLLYLAANNNLSLCLACNVTVPYCLMCLNLTTCSGCQAVAFLNPQKTCSLCSLYLPNCLYCNSSNACLTCNSPYYLNTNSTCELCSPLLFGTLPGPAKIPLCLVCKYQGAVPVCLTCLLGYYTSLNKCQPCSASIPHCASCATASICLQCSPSYYLSPFGNDCLPCPPTLTNCATCNSTGICLTCLDNCYLNTTLNQCFECQILTPGCDQCNDNATCTSCLDGYYLTGVACMSCKDVMADCLLCESGEKCLLVAGTTETATSLADSPNWMYLAIGCLAAVLLIVVLGCLYRKYRKNQENSYRKEETQRQLSEKKDVGNEVQIGKERHCQKCRRREFQVMNFELLCGECEGKEGRGRAHRIRREVRERTERSQTVVKGKEGREGKEGKEGKKKREGLGNKKDSSSKKRDSSSRHRESLEKEKERNGNEQRESRHSRQKSRKRYEREQSRVQPYKPNKRSKNNGSSRHQRPSSPIRDSYMQQPSLQNRLPKTKKTYSDYQDPPVTSKQLLKDNRSHV